MRVLSGEVPCVPRNQSVLEGEEREQSRTGYLLRGGHAHAARVSGCAEGVQHEGGHDGRLSVLRDREELLRRLQLLPRLRLRPGGDLGHGVGGRPTRR